MNKYPIEKQVCTREQSKKLKELLGDGAPESLWVHTQVSYPICPSMFMNKTILRSALREWHHKEFYAAYTGDELGALLPSDIKICLSIVPGSTGYIADYFDITRGILCDGPRNRADTLAKSLAELLIQGLEEGWIKKENVHY